MWHVNILYRIFMTSTVAWKEMQYNVLGSIQVQYNTKHHARSDITNEIKTALIICASKVTAQSPQRIKPHFKPESFAVFTQATTNYLSV